MIFCGQCTHHLPYRFYEADGVVHVRQLPCLCSKCFVGDFAHCKNADYVGRFKRSVMKTKGKRQPKRRYLEEEQEVEQEAQEWVVRSIQGKRYLRGKLQYLLEWEGYDEMMQSKMIF